MEPAYRMQSVLAERLNCWLVLTTFDATVHSQSLPHFWCACAAAILTGAHGQCMGVVMYI